MESNIASCENSFNLGPYLGVVLCLSAGIMLSLPCLMQLYAPMPIMIWIAIVIEAALKNGIDAGILLAIQFINATLGW